MSLLDLPFFIIILNYFIIITIIIMVDNLTIINVKVFETLLTKLSQKKVKQFLILIVGVVLIINIITLKILFNNQQFNILSYLQ